MLPFIFFRLKDVACMVRNEGEIICFSSDRIKVLMDFALEMSVLIQANHPACPKIIIMYEIRVIEIALNIVGTAILLICAALEKIYENFGIFKPLIIININKPFAICAPDSLVTCLREITAPGKRIDLTGIFTQFGK